MVRDFPPPYPVFPSHCDRDNDGIIDIPRESDVECYYKIQLYCVKLYRTSPIKGDVLMYREPEDIKDNCFEPYLYILSKEEKDTGEDTIIRHNAYINDDTERSRLYFSPYNETDMEEVHFFIADQRSAPDECYPYRYTFSIEEITAGDEC